jgi:hypothetical protein
MCLLPAPSWTGCSTTLRSLQSADAATSYRLKEGAAEQNQRQATQAKKDKSAASLRR